MQSALILAIMTIGAVGQVGTMLRMIRARLLTRYIAFFGLVLLTLSRAVLAILSRGHLHPYREFWASTQWLLVSLGAAAAIEAFWRLALHFRNIGGFGFILLSTIAGVATMAGFIVTAINSSWNGPLRGPLMVGQCVELSLMLIATLSLVFFRLIPSIPVRPNAIRHLLILVTLFGSSFAGSFIFLIGQGKGLSVFAANLFITAGMSAAYWWWALRMNDSGEVLPFSVPPLASPGQIEALEQWDRRLYAEGKAVVGVSDKIR